MDAPRGEQVLQEKDTDVPFPGRSSIASKVIGSQGRQNKQSFDYAARSGLAGGLAACAVCA